MIPWPSLFVLIITFLNTACQGLNTTVETFAGSGDSGSADGDAFSSSFKLPFGITMDKSGNIFVADYANSKIRKVNATGYVTTIAGSGANGADDGYGSSSSFGFPWGLCADSLGNVYVADTGNNKIRKINATGYVSTFAGNGQFYGGEDGAALEAGFSYPQDCAIDTSGNIFVTDTYNNKIRIINITTGYVSTFASGLNRPVGLAVDKAGNVFVADRGNLQIRKINATGFVSILAGDGSSGAQNGWGPSSSFINPTSVAVDMYGSVYVADSNLIRKINATGYVSTVAGMLTWGSKDGPALNSTFSGVFGIAVDDVGRGFVSDYPLHKIRVIKGMNTQTWIAN